MRWLLLVTCDQEQVAAAVAAARTLQAGPPGALQRLVRAAIRIGALVSLCRTASTCIVIRLVGAGLAVLALLQCSTLYRHMRR